MAKKSATNKKSSKPQPAAKKATAKKATAEASPSKAAASGKRPAKAGSTITEADWAQIYAKAWLDDGFRTLLETDPTAALKQYAKEHGLSWKKLVQVPRAGAPAVTEPDENCIHLVSCC